MRDPNADVGRRAWARCPRCAGGSGCPACATGRSCETHWRFLLAAEGRRLFVQCPGCWYRWWHDTGFGAGEHRLGVVGVPDFPARGVRVA